jgi:hypothetical protein
MRLRCYIPQYRRNVRYEVCGHTPRGREKPRGAAFTSHIPHSVGGEASVVQFVVDTTLPCACVVPTPWSLVTGHRSLVTATALPVPKLTPHILERVTGSRAGSARCNTPPIVFQFLAAHSVVA